MKYRKVDKNPMLDASLAIVLAMVFTGCSRCVDTAGYTTEHPISLDDEPSKPEFEMKGLGRAGAPPPLVPEALGSVSGMDLVGPRNARIAWNLRLPFRDIADISKDGTVYLDGVAAVRDGKLLWAYKAHGIFGLAADGRVWLHTAGGGGYYCLNRNGEGGLLSTSFQAPHEADGSRRERISCLANGLWLRNQESTDVPLDRPCTSADAVLGPDGIAYLGTDTPDLRALSDVGDRTWKRDDIYER